MTNYNTLANREWWAQRWIDHIESFGRMPRLARARNYAREGNVVRLEFSGAKVLARVQGTAPEPYKVSLSLDPFDDEQWQYVIESMAEQAVFSAKLLAGEMPQNIETVFTVNGLSLFPLTKFDIHSKCSCPDKANPCKHIGAVYYLLGDRFSDDPFVLFQLRGRTRDQIIADLRRLRTPSPATDATTAPASEPSSPLANSTKKDSAPPAEAQIAATQAEEQASPKSPWSLEAFWQYSGQLESSLVVITPALGADTVLDTLGPLPLKLDTTTNAAQPVMEELRGIYEQVGQQAMISAMTAGPSSESMN